MNKSEFFKPSDFAKCKIDLPVYICEVANAKLNEALGQQVYINNKAGTHWTTFKTQHDEHTAYLFNIQPIKECEHKKVERIGYEYCPTTGKTQFDVYECQDCNKQLEPTGWRVRE